MDYYIIDSPDDVRAVFLYDYYQHDDDNDDDDDDGISKRVSTTLDVIKATRLFNRIHLKCVSTALDVAKATRLFNPIYLKCVSTALDVT